MTLSSANGATISDGRATGTIIDNDGARPSLSIGDASATEGQSLTFEVTLSAAAASTVTVQYRTANGTASSSDYTSASGTLRFSAGETRKTISVRTTDDTRDENNETITVTLSSANGATISDGRAAGTGTIIDNEPRSLSIADASATEGQSLTFVVTLSPAAAWRVEVSYSTSELLDPSASDPSDYIGTSGWLVFAAGESRKTISVRTIDDTRDESNETFYMLLNLFRGLSRPPLSDRRATGTIIDNDGASPSPADQDHGNSRSTAHELSNCGSGNRDWTINGGLTAGDKDYFKLVCDDARGTLTAWTTGSTDTYGTLQYGNGDRAVANDDGGQGGNFRVSRSATVGTYYLEVKGYSSRTTGSYVLRVQWRPYDTSDRYQDADRITSGSSYPRYIHRNDADWFKFDPGSGGGCIDVRVWSSVESRLSSFDTDPAAFVSDGQGGTKLMEDDDSGAGLNFRMSGRLRKHGYFYFVQVTPAGVRGLGPYTLHLRVSNASSCSGVLN